MILGQRNEINGTNGPNTGDVQGLLTFSNFNSATVGNEYANLLLGDIQSYQQDSAQIKYHNRYEIYEPYIQDDWKVNSRLQLNLGIRFSIFGNYHENNEQAWNWDPTKYVQPDQFLHLAQDGRLLYKHKALPIPLCPTSPAPCTFDLTDLSPYLTNGLVECGTAASGVPPTCMRPHKFNPAPRIGFAFDPRGDGRTSIRAGYGVFFEHGTGSEANTGSLVGGAPLNLTMTQIRPYSIGTDGYPCIGGIGGPSLCNSGTGAYPIDVTSIPRKAIWPYVQQWSFSIQREVTHNTVVSLAYVGSKGTHLTAVRQPNALPSPPTGSDSGILLNGNPYGPHQPIISNSALLGVSDCSNLGSIEKPKFVVNGVPDYQRRSRLPEPAGRLRKFQFIPTASDQRVSSVPRDPEDLLARERRRFELSRLPGNDAPDSRSVHRRHVVLFQPFDRRFIGPQRHNDRESPGGRSQQGELEFRSAPSAQHQLCMDVAVLQIRLQPVARMGQ